MVDEPNPPIVPIKPDRRLSLQNVAQRDPGYFTAPTVTQHQLMPGDGGENAAAPIDDKKS